VSSNQLQVIIYLGTLIIEGVRLVYVALDYLRHNGTAAGFPSEAACYASAIDLGVSKEIYY